MEFEFKFYGFFFFYVHFYENKNSKNHNKMSQSAVSNTTAKHKTSSSSSSWLASLFFSKWGWAILIVGAVVMFACFVSVRSRVRRFARAVRARALAAGGPKILVVVPCGRRASHNCAALINLIYRRARSPLLVDVIAGETLSTVGGDDRDVLAALRAGQSGAMDHSARVRAVAVAPSEPKTGPAACAALLSATGDNIKSHGAVVFLAPERVGGLTDGWDAAALELAQDAAGDNGVVCAPPVPDSTGAGWSAAVAHFGTRSFQPLPAADAACCGAPRFPAASYASNAPATLAALRLCTHSERFANAPAGPVPCPLLNVAVLITTPEGARRLLARAPDAHSPLSSFLDGNPTMTDLVWTGMAAASTLRLLCAHKPIAFDLPSKNKGQTALPEAAAAEAHKTFGRACGRQLGHSLLHPRLLMPPCVRLGVCVGEDPHEIFVKHGSAAAFRRRKIVLAAQDNRFYDKQRHSRTARRLPKLKQRRQRSRERPSQRSRQRSRQQSRR